MNRRFSTEHVQWPQKRTSLTIHDYSELRRKMDPEEAQWIEQVIIKGKHAVKILSICQEQAVSKGYNYSSYMQRLKVKVLHESGEADEKYFIYKKIPRHEVMAKIAEETGSFVKEIRMYLETLPVMESIRLEKGFEGGPLWPTCYGVRGNEALLLDDLSAKGYKMADRLNGLDFHHSCVVVRSLARFHALAYNHIKRGNFNANDYKIMHWASDPKKLEMLYKQCIKGLANAIECQWGGEWNKFTKGLHKLSRILSVKVSEYFLNIPGTFHTLNHGDCWINNMLFLYGSGGMPKHVRFIDFQVSHYNPPGPDLVFFLNSSLSFKTLPKKLELLQIYYDSLLSNLKDLDCPEANIPTYEDIKEGYDAGKYYGLAVGLCKMPLSKAPEELLPEPEKFFETFLTGEVRSSNLCSYDGEEMVNSLKYFIKEAHEEGLLEI